MSVLRSLSSSEFDKLIGETMPFIRKYLEGINSSVGTRRDETKSQQFSFLVEDQPPQVGIPLPLILKTLFEDVIPYSLPTQSPTFFAYTPGGGVTQATIGGLIAEIIHKPSQLYVAAPALAHLEINVIKWLCDIIDFEGTTSPFGTLTSGGSTATISALICARVRYFGKTGNFLNGVIYLSDQCHHCVSKAAMLLGFIHIQKIASIPSRGYKMDTSLLIKQIAKDREAGLLPFCIVGSAGTTATATVDDLITISEICKSENCWFHVDAAFLGFYAITSRGRDAMVGMNRADSVVLDPHKSFFQPFGMGALLVKERKNLFLSHSDQVGLYLIDLKNINNSNNNSDNNISNSDDKGFASVHRDGIDFFDYSVELSRPNRSLRLWLAIKIDGMNVYKNALDRCMDLTNELYLSLREMVCGIVVM